jgi:uracil-DNA glycosylase family 4
MEEIDLCRAARQIMQSYQRAGVTDLRVANALDLTPLETALSAFAGTMLPQEQSSTSSPPAPKSESPGNKPSAAKPSENKQSKLIGLSTPGSWPQRTGTPADMLAELAAEVAGCVQCKELASTRKQTVFGVGNPDARLCFFGEAPGADEDKQGEPFVGKAGQLLTKIIEACTLRREEVYILNTLKCRPPGNRNPAQEELANCAPFWEKQMEIVQPEFIVCLGTFAAQTLLDTVTSIGKLRSKFHTYRGAKVIATYHPSYLLRNPAAKKPVWEDMQLLLAEMGISLRK